MRWLLLLVSHTMRVFSLTMMATTALMATALCASLPEGGLGYLGDLEAAEGDLADLQAGWDWNL